MRSTRTRTLATTLSAALMLLACAPAYAQWDKDIDLGVHALGYFGGNFLTEPGDKVVQVNGAPYEAIYPGFGGTGQGGGLALDFRYAGIIGLELGVIFTSEQAKGEVNDLNITLSHSATHVPVMLKIAAPTELIRPYAMIGWQFSFVSDSKADFEGNTQQFSAKDEDYSGLAFGFGFEIALPIEGVDLRIPISVRGAWNTSITDKAEDRGDYERERITYSTAFEYHAAGTLGLAWYFL
jgi:opacity protein-like surface antigen